MDYKITIKEYMKKNHITYADLASALGVSRQRVWTMLNSNTSINLKTLQKVCKVLGLELSMFSL